MLRKHQYPNMAPDAEGAGGSPASPPAAPPAPPAATPAPSAAPTTTPPAASQEPKTGPNVDKEIEDIFRFNPFQDAMDEKPPAEATPPGTPQPPEAKPPAPVATPTVPPEVETLKQEVAALRALVAAGVNPAQAQQQPAQPQQEDFFKDIPQYPVQVPDQLFDAMNSEDVNTRRGALNALLSTHGRIVHAMVTRDMTARIAALVPQQVQQITQRQTEERAVFDDFYTRHKDLNNPALRPMVVQVAAQVMQQQNSTQYTPQIGDIIAERTRSVLRQLVPQASAPVVPNGPAVVSVNTGVRPTERPQNDVMSTLF